MDLMPLSKTTFQPTGLVEGWDSLIWTERYTYNGEFELKTYMVDETRDLIPELSLVCIRESKEVMFVENSVIEVDDKGVEYMTVTGRSFETFLENRYTKDYDGYREKQKAQIEYTNAGFVMLLIWNFFVNMTATDAVNPTFPSWEPDVIPNFLVTDGIVSGSATTKTKFLVPGIVYDEVLKYLVRGKLGIRAIRPYSDGKVIVFDPNDGTATRTDTTGIEELRLDVYNGINRTSTVIFDYGAGHLVKPKYIFSSQNFKRSIYVGSTFGTSENYRDGDPGASDPFEYTGLERRTGFVDIGSKPSGATSGEWGDFVEDATEKNLAEAEEVALFDATAALNSPYVYGTHYDLGDRVLLQGKHGLKTTCRVVEYIRSQDKLGETGYPTLSRV